MTEETTTKPKAWCCFIDDKGSGCTSPPEYTLYDTFTPSLDGYTHACEAHVGALLFDRTEVEVWSDQRIETTA